MNRKRFARWAALAALAMLVVTGAGLLLPPEMLAQPVSQAFTNILLRGLTRLADNGVIAPSNTGKGAIGTTTLSIGKVTADSVRLGNTVGGASGAIQQKVFNVSGSSIPAGDFLVWDAGPAITVVDATEKGYTSAQVTIADDLTDETANGGWFSLIASIVGTADADSIQVWGKDEDGDAQSVTLALTDGATTTTMVLGTAGTVRLYWTDIDSVSTEKSNGGSLTNITVTAEGYATVIASDGANTDFAGVAIATIADNDVGFICIYGPVDGVVDAATTVGGPGTLLELASGGDAITDAAATTAKNVGVLLEDSNKDNFKGRCFIFKN